MKAKKGGSLGFSRPRRALNIAARPSIMNNDGIDNRTMALMFTIVPLSAEVPKLAPAPNEKGVPAVFVRSGPMNLVTWMPRGGCL
jgi:hypothetical protein